MYTRYMSIYFIDENDNPPIAENGGYFEAEVQEVNDIGEF